MSEGGIECGINQRFAICRLQVVLIDQLHGFNEFVR